MMTLLRRLDRKRFRVSLAVVDTRDAVHLCDLPADVELHDLDATRVRYALPRLIALVWRLRPDVVFSTLGHLNLALSMLRWLLPRQVRCIARETTIVSCGVQEYRFPALWSVAYRRFYRNFDRVVCQSRAMQQDLVANYAVPAAKTVVINNPLDVDAVRAAAQAPLAWTTPPGAERMLVAAGRLGREKGFDLLIDAIALSGDPGLHLVLLGNGGLLATLRDLAVKRGVAAQVHFVGFQSNPHAWFRQAGAFVLSSRYEGFPNVVLEALACGTPVIATPAPGGTREILDGVPGCVVATDVSARALADAIMQWLRGPQVRVPADAVNPYRLDRIVGQYERLLQDSLEPAAP